MQIWRLVKTLLPLLLRRPLVGVGVIPRLPEGQIVLIRKRDTQRWGFPGGLVDWGETIEMAVRRELKEETGLDLISIQRMVGVYSEPDRDPRMHSICITVAAEVTGRFRIQDQDEIQEVQAFEIPEVLAQVSVHDHQQQWQDYLSQSQSTGLR